MAASIERDFAAFVERRAAEGKTRGPLGPAIALLGLPDDTGIALNHGRAGAASGPTAFRAALARYGTDYDTQRRAALEVPIVDAGDIVPAAGASEGALLETHERVARAVRALHEHGLLPVCVGGGHDLTLPAVRGLAEAAPAAVMLGGINVDAHLDVRVEIGSGMPFRRLIEDGFVDPHRFVTFGAARFVHRADHVAWLEGVGGTLIDVETVQREPAAVERAFEVALGAETAAAGAAEMGGPPAIFVSIDLDALDGAHAPGVSAVNPAGLDVPAVTRIAERAGAEPHVRHFDLMELSPPHDVDGCTARVAALLFLHFLAGVAGRGPTVGRDG
ncbi:MAG: formimidoylglutamase [Gemmatimonadota bacterium]